MKKKSKKEICFQCDCRINKKEDLYYIIISIDRHSISKRTCYLDLCETCFHTNMDDKIINRLKELSNGNKVFEENNDGKKITKNWRMCPYCQQTLQYANVKSNFQISELLGTDLNTVAIHTKCYFHNIGISEEYFHD